MTEKEIQDAHEEHSGIRVEDMEDIAEQAKAHTEVTKRAIQEALIEEMEKFPSEYLPPDILFGFESRINELKEELK